MANREQREYLCAVLGDAVVANLAMAKLAYCHPEHVLDFGVDFLSTVDCVATATAGALILLAP